MQTDASRALIQPAIRVVAAGLGAAVAGPLGLALGGFVGDALGKPGADLIKKYLEDFGKEAGKKFLETSADTLAEKLKNSAADLAALYREAFRRSLAQIRSEGDSAFDDWFGNWDVSLNSSAPLNIEEIQLDKLDLDALEILFSQTLERLDAQGAAIHQKGTSILLNTRRIPEVLAADVKNRLPERFKESFNELIRTPEYSEAWVQAQQLFQTTTTNLLTAVKSDTNDIKSGVETANEKLDEVLRFTAASAEKEERLLRSSESQSAFSPIDPFSSVPPPPPSFISRPEVIEPLIESILSQSTVGVKAIEGMGGVGKTIVAGELCRDKRVREAFPNGILWFTIGKQSDLSPATLIQQIAQFFNQQFRSYSEAAYRTLLQDKAVLVVLDDVWTLDIIEPFRIESGRSRLLYTSRDRNLAASLNADNHEIGLLKEGQARRFLLQRSGREKTGLPDPYATEILAQCKGLVLALAMIGGALKGKPNREWSYMCQDLKKPQPRLKEIGVRAERYGYETLYASIAASVDALDATARMRYLRLAVLLEDMAAQDTLLQALWGGERRDVQRTMGLLVDRSLAAQDAQGSIRLHDFQLDFVRGEYPDSAALALIHSALLRSLHVVRPQPEQFTSQMTGRLLSYLDQSGIAAFVQGLDLNAQRPRLWPLWPALEVANGPVRGIFKSAGGRITALAITPDGRRAIFASVDETLTVWDLDSNQPPRSFKGQDHYIECLALTADGLLAATGSSDGYLRAWNLDDKQCARTWKGSAGLFWAIAFTTDGKRIISGSNFGELRFWVLEDDGQEYLLPRKLDWCRNILSKGEPDWNKYLPHTEAVALTSDARRSISGSVEGILEILDLDGNEPRRFLQGHIGPVYSVSLTPDGRCAVSGSSDGTLRVWDADDDRNPRILQGDPSQVVALALTNNGRRAISGTFNGTLQVWDLESEVFPQHQRMHRIEASAIAVDGKRIVCGTSDGNLLIWDLDGQGQPQIITGRRDRISAIAVTTDGLRAISASSASGDEALVVWNLQDEQVPARVLSGEIDYVDSLLLVDNDRRLVSASSSGTLQVWDLASGQAQVFPQGHTGWIRAIASTADGRYLVSAADDQTVRVWNLERIEPLYILEGHTSWIWGIAITSDDRYAVSASWDCTLRVWDLMKGEPLRVLQGHADRLSDVVVTPDGRYAVSASEDKTLRVWDLQSGRTKRLLNGHTGKVTRVALSIDGQLAVSVSDDLTLRVWSIQSGKCLTVFNCDTKIVFHAWTAQHVVAIDELGHVHLFAWQDEI
jgi:WD40 repeat protein